MERLVIKLMQSKAFQKFGVAGATITLVLFLLNQYHIISFKYSLPIVAAVILAILAYQVFLKGVSKKKAASFESGLQKDVGTEKGGKISQRKAQSEIADRWKTAVVEIKKAGMDLYTLPWYLLIGEPQSGKSTTLKNSGLEFPVGTEALSGAGGTRNCDWWFTNEAIVLDTAGRFTFQEQNAPDQAEFKTFLKLLSKNRPRCPINGVILVIPCSSLLGDSDEVRDQKAQNIREKLTQLQRELEVQFPVFILITKADQILGFTEFFSRIPATDQRQILGWSMPGPFIQAYDPAKFNGVFDQLCTRIHKLRLKLLGEDIPLTEVDKLYVFPEEFRALREPLNDYLKTIFVKTHYLPELFFRGFYFTSGLQEGKPIAKACAAMIRNAGPGADELVENLAKTFARSKAFFIRDFYTDKLFREKSMIVHSVKKMGVTRKLGLFAIVGSVLLILATSAFMVWRIGKIKRELSDLHEVAKEVRTEFIASVDNDKGVPPQDELDDLFRRTAESIDRSQWFGMKSEDFVASIGDLEEELRDMYWMHFARNVLYQQSRALYRQMMDQETGASLAEGPAQDSYLQYIPLWSLNHEWVRHTSGGGGAFRSAKDIKMPKLVTYGAEDNLDAIVGGLDESFARDFEELEERYQDEFGFFRDAISEDLDFSDDLVRDGDRPPSEIDDATVNPPVKVDLVYGPLEPAENEAIAREIAFLHDELQPPSSETLDGIKQRAADFRSVFAEKAALLTTRECGYADPSVNPFEQIQKTAAEIRESYAGLRDFVEQNNKSLNAFAMSEDEIKSQFDIIWAEKATGEPREKIDAMIDEKVQSILASYREKQEAYQKDIAEIQALVSDQGGAEFVLNGVDALTKLTEALNAQIAALSQQGGWPTSDAAAEGVLKNWQTNSDRAAADAWVKEAAAGGGATPEGASDWKPQITSLSETIQSVIANGDDAVLVEAKLQYALKTSPGTLMGSSQINSASLKADGHPRGAIATEVKKAETQLRDLMSALANTKSECPTSRERLSKARSSLQGVINSNRANLVKYWETAYNSWRPVDWFDGVADWSALKGSNLFTQPGALAARFTDDLRPLYDNLTDYKSFEDANLFDMKVRFDAISRYMQSGSMLEQNLNTFASTLGSMNSDKDQASLAYFGNDQLKKNLEALAGTRDVGEKFSAFEPRVASLLKDPAELLQKVIADFLNYWEPKVGGKFPFNVDPANIKNEPNDKGVQQALIPQVTIKELREFFFDPTHGLIAVLDPYEDYYEKTWSQLPQNRPVKEFVDRCRNLRSFYFEGDSDQYKKITIAATYTGLDLEPARKGDIKDLELHSSARYFKAPGANEFRWFREDRGRTREGLEWTPSDYGTGEIMQFRTEHPESNTINTKSLLQVPGDFSLLAYIVTHDDNSPTNERKKWNRVLFIMKPDNSRISRDTWGQTFNFELDRTLPEMPDWTAVSSWKQAR